MRPFPVWLLVVPLLAFGQSATAQELAQDRAPRFLLALDSRLTPVDIERTPLLGRRLSLSLNGATIKEALGEIGRQSGLRLAYGDDLLPPDARVHLRAEGITVVAALTDVLFDTDVDVVFSPNGRATLVRRPDRTQGGTVTGRVTDAKTSRAIPNVSVFLEGTRWRATTREDGGYRVTDVAPGTYILTASRIGYARQSQSVTVGAGQEVTVDLALQAAATELEQVVVTGTVVPTERKAVPTPISVITGDEMEQKGYQRLDQIFRGDMPGAIAWDNGALNYTSDINIRGSSRLGFGYVKTYVDGIEIADPRYLVTIDPSSIDRIEVLRGPQGSTIYGSDASGGVMQIFTRKGEFDTRSPQFEAMASAGLIESPWVQKSHLDEHHSLAVTGGLPGFSYRIGGDYFHQGEWAPGFHTNNTSLDGGVRGTQGPLTVELSARYYGQIFGWPLDPRFRDAGYTYFSKPFDQTDDIKQETYGIALTYMATSHWQHNLTLGYDGNAADYYLNRPRFTTPGDSFVFVESFDVRKVSLGYHSTYSVPVGRAVQSSLTAGADYWSYHLSAFYAASAAASSGVILSPSYGLRSKYDNTGYFAQEQLGLWDRLFVTVGLRAEDNQNFGKDFGLAWAPRVGVSYVHDIDNLAVKARVAYGRGIRPPPPGDADAVATPYAKNLANPNLGPERQVGTDGGFELYLNRTGSIGVTYYNQRATDLIDYVLVNPSTTPPQYQYQNVGRIRNKGWEFEGRMHAGPWSLTGTYSVTTSVVQQLSPTYTGDLQPGDQMLHIPKHTAGATLSYSLARTAVTLGLTHVGSWIESDNFALYGDYYGGQPYRGSGRDYWTTYPAFTKVNISVSQTVTKRFSLFLRSDNLTNNSAFEHDNLNLTSGRVTTIGVRTKL